MTDVNFRYPPRPQSRIMASQLGAYEADGGWCAQYKYNGTRNIIRVRKDGRVDMVKRLLESHKQFHLIDAISDQIRKLALKPNTGYLLDSELLHSKTKTIKNTIVLFDVLWAGRWLYGSTVRERLDILGEICRRSPWADPPVMLDNPRALVISDNIWLAPTFTRDLAARYDECLPDDAREGLVLKKLGAKLTDFGHKYFEVGWQIRCRKEHKNYRF